MQDHDMSVTSMLVGLAISLGLLLVAFGWMCLSEKLAERPRWPKQAERRHARRGKHRDRA
jgi:hypothetical protein